MDLLLDIIMISLLTLTIGFCWQLNNKIVELKGSRKDLNNLVKTFDIAIIKTHKSIADLKVMSIKSSADLQLYVNKASELLEDLSFMNDSASNAADRLENAIKNARSSYKDIINATEQRKIHATEQSRNRSLPIQPEIKNPANHNKNYESPRSNLLSSRKELMKAMKIVKGD